MTLMGSANCSLWRMLRNSRIVYFLTGACNVFNLPKMEFNQQLIDILFIAFMLVYSSNWISS